MSCKWACAVNRRGKTFSLLCYAICLCYADGVCFIISCVAYRIFHYRRVGNASWETMGDMVKPMCIVDLLMRMIYRI